MSDQPAQEDNSEGDSQEEQAPEVKAGFFRANAENLLFACVSIGFLGYVLFRLVRIPDIHYLEVVYSSIAVLLSVGAALALLLPRDAKRNLLLVGGAAGLSTLVGIAVLHFVGSDPMQVLRQALISLRPDFTSSSAVTVRRVQPADNRDVNSVVGALRASGIEAYRSPSLRSLLDAADDGVIPILPLSGISRATTVNCNEGDQQQFPVAVSDRYGFNNEDTVFALRHSKVLLVGDSFVYGQCVHQEQTIAGHLRRKGYAAVSVGVGGNGPLLNLAALREYGSLLQPKTVVWFYTVGNDLMDLRDHELRSRILVNYLDPAYSQKLAARQDDVDRLWKSIWDDPVRWKPVFDAYGAKSAAYASNGQQEAETILRRLQSVLGTSGAAIDSVKNNEDVAKIFGQILRVAKRDVQSWGGTLYFSPIWGATYYRLGRSPSYTEAILAEVQAAGVSVIDVDPAIKASGDHDRYFPVTKDVPHHNSNGYELFAESIAAALAPRSGIHVHEATFGNSCKDAKLEFPVVNIVRPGNATQGILGLCGGKSSCQFDIGNHLVGGDPAGGCVKDFEMNWMCIESKRSKKLYVEKNRTGTARVSLTCRNGDPVQNISTKQPVSAPAQPAPAPAMPQAAVPMPEIHTGPLSGNPVDRFEIEYQSYVGISNTVSSGARPQNSETVSILGYGLEPKDAGHVFRARVSVPVYASQKSAFVVGVFLNGSATANAFQRIEIDAGTSATAEVEFAFNALDKQPIGLDVRIGVESGGRVYLNGSDEGANPQIGRPRLVVEIFPPS